MAEMNGAYFKVLISYIGASFLIYLSGLNSVLPYVYAGGEEGGCGARFLLSEISVKLLFLLLYSVVIFISLFVNGDTNLISKENSFYNKYIGAKTGNDFQMIIFSLIYVAVTIHLIKYIYFSFNMPPVGEIISVSKICKY